MTPLKIRSDLKIKGGNLAQVYEEYDTYCVGVYLTKHGWLPVRWNIPSGRIDNSTNTNLDLNLEPYNEPEAA